MGLLETLVKLYKEHGNFDDVIQKGAEGENITQYCNRTITTRIFNDKNAQPDEKGAISTTFSKTIGMHIENRFSSQWDNLSKYLTELQAVSQQVDAINNEIASKLSNLLNVYFTQYALIEQTAQLYVQLYRTLPVSTERILTGSESINDFIEGNSPAYFNYKALDEESKIPASISGTIKLGKILIKLAETIAAQEEKEAAENDPDNLSDKEMLDAWRKSMWAGTISGPVNSMLDTLESLYRSGIESMPPAGILVNNGADDSPLICVKANKITEGQFDCRIANELDTGSAYDLQIMSTIAPFIDGLTCMTGIDPQTAFPTYESLLTNKGVMRDAHLMFQTANIVFSGKDNNKNSIRKWIKETKGVDSKTWLKENNSQSARLSKWKDVRDWYKWVLENTLFRYFHAAGLTPDVKLSASAQITNITTMLALKLKNIVSVSERISKKQVMQTTELKIATDKTIDIENLANQLMAVLNIGNARDITCKARMADSQVACLSIIYDQDAANSSTVFAASIIDNVIASGNTPSWSHVLMGRKEDGNFHFMNFMDVPDAAACSYAIYAGSGAGKGNMTLTLMAAALADARQVFYIDGKPDSGGSIANLAWRDKKECFVFDGQPKGSGSSFPGIFEEHPVMNGMRTVEEVIQYETSIPQGIFKSNDEKKEFLGVCRYLRCMNLCLEILNARGAAQLPKDNWHVWVFDEMTAMSEHEKSVRKMFGTYIANKGKTNCFSITKATKENPNGGGIVLAPTKGDKLNKAIEEDSGIAYIVDWLDWVGQIPSKVTNLVKIALRQAEANIILIFQKADWLAVDCGLTTIGKFAMSLDCRKIAGKDSLANACGPYGDGNTMKADWYTNRVAQSGGWWAVTTNADIRKSDKESHTLEIVKPYSIWGYRKVGDTKSPEENFFDYYVNKLAVICKKPVSEVLQDAYDYASRAIQTLAEQGIITPAKDAKDYVYNVAHFCTEAEELAADSLHQEYEENGGSNPLDDYNKPIMGSSEYDRPEAPIMPIGMPTGTPMGTPEMPIDMLTGKPIGEGPIEPMTSTSEYDSEYDDDSDIDVFGDGGETERFLHDTEEMSDTEMSDIMSEMFGRDTPETTPTSVRPTGTEASDGRAPAPAMPADFASALRTVQQGLNAMGYTFNINAITAAEANSARTLQAMDTSRIAMYDKTGRTVFIDKTIPREHRKLLQRGANGNYVPVTHTPITNSLFMTDKVNKLEKQIARSWNEFVNSLIKSLGGRAAIRQIKIDQTTIAVNGKLVEHSFLSNDYIDSLEEIADLHYLLDECTRLIELFVSTQMFELLIEQYSDDLVKASVKAGKELQIHELLFKKYRMLNSIVVLNSGKPVIVLRKKDLTNANEERSRIIADQLAAMQANIEAKNNIGGIRQHFMKTNETARKSKPVVSRSRRRTMSKSNRFAGYRGGVFGWGASKLLGIFSK